MNMIEVKNLSKNYHVVKKEGGLKGALKALVTRESKVISAVKNLNFTIEAGEIIGFIGPNGGGKAPLSK